MLSDLANRWLRYARSVFSCNGHHAACDAPAVHGIDPSIRWPGFIGPNYESAGKRLLLVGRVHNPMGWLEWPGLGALQPIIHEWLDGTHTDEQFYKDYSREYARRLSAWGPWRKVYGALASAAGTDETGVVYTNVAKCWQYAGKESKMQRACSGVFPLEDLVDIVKPHGVFLLAPDAWVSRIPGSQIRSVPFRNDSAPHFQIPHGRLTEAISWVRAL